MTFQCRRFKSIITPDIPVHKDHPPTEISLADACFMKTQGLFAAVEGIL